jgi:hypothetical protein
MWLPRLNLGERLSRSDAKERVEDCAGLSGGKYVLMYASYLPQIGRCAHYELVEKHPVKGDHMSFGNILARKLVGLKIPREEV